MQHRFKVAGDHIVGDVFDGEAVIIDTVSGAYYSLEQGPAAAWPVIAGGGRTAAEIAGECALDEALVVSLLAELVGAGLVTVDGALDVAAPSTSYLTKYSDMEELLLLDPLHDVAPSGWPAAASPSDTSS